MSRLIYVELSRYVRESRTVCVEVPDDFDAEDLDAEDLHRRYRDAGGEFAPDYGCESYNEDARSCAEVPDPDVEEDFLLRLVDEDDA